MANFAIIDGDHITNVIVAESKEIAEQITGKEAIETDGNPWIGWILIDGVWVLPEPEAIIEGEVVPQAIEG